MSHSLYKELRGRYFSVGKTTRYGMEGPGPENLFVKIFCSSCLSITGMGHNKLDTCAISME